MHLVFVYGTLQRGERYHAWLESATYVGAHVTEACFTLHDLGAYPGAGASGCTALTGELYLVDDDTLARLDELEEVPELYTREPLPTPHGSAFVYVLRAVPRDARLIEGGDWRRRELP